MDPTTCCLEMFEAMRDGDFETGRERALSLKAWLENGGFYPLRYAKAEVDAYVANVLRRTASLD